MAGNRKQTQQYRTNRAAILDGNPDCYWGCGNKATQADHLIEHDAGGDDSTANLVPSCRTCNSKRGAIYVNNKTAQRQQARNQALNAPPNRFSFATGSAFSVDNFDSSPFFIEGPPLSLAICCLVNANGPGLGARAVELPAPSGPSIVPPRKR